VIPGAVPAAPRELRRSAGLGRKIAMVVGGIVGVTGLTFGTFCVLYSPGFPKYTLTPDALTIRDFFYPLKLDRRSVDADRIRLVNIDVDTDWQPIGKTNGFANSHYESGWFRVANGQKVRMYRRAHGRRLVLLPPRGDGAVLLLEVQQPEKFIDEMRREWLNGS
jgi:hypothetical protein